MLGDKLRAERERQNLTIKDIEKGTSIRALYIECIEKGEYGSLPGEVYTKGFIRNYATFLKLDANAFVQEFNEEVHPEVLQQPEEVAADAAEEKDDSFDKGSVKVSFEDNAHRQNKILAAVICLLVLGGAYFLLATGDDGQVAKAPQQVKQETAAVKEAPKAEESKAAAAPAKRDDVEVVAKFDDRCWTQVIADGKTLYEGTMEKGKTMSWKAKETVSITAGNAGAVALSVNGQDMGKVGETGQVVEKVFTPSGEKKEADKKTK